MKQILLFIWQLPQNILGLLVILFAGARQWNLFYWRSSRGRFGVSLGYFIVFGALSDKYIRWSSVKHERGHQKQSLYLGPLYLLLVGLPSVLGNIWDRLFHKQWSNDKRERWYYSRYPENWADKLGDVKRF